MVPTLTKIGQTFDSTHIKDVPGEVVSAILASGLTLTPGARIAITIGSRGIANIADIAAATVKAVRALGGDPFIIPAMGSHGGATAEGQREVLAGYGVTEDYVKAPILSSMKVTELDSTGLEHKLYMDSHAAGADGVIAVNRVKVHTDFHGPTESGVMKMLVIGLGKHAQALAMHSFGVRGLRDLIPIAARRIIGTGKIVLGLGICENAYDQTALIRAMLPGQIEAIELEMIDWNRAHMPSIPFDELDLLIVDQMGKDISGAGLDTNIIGRMYIDGEIEPARPRIKNILADDLTDASHGNATGVGLADFITEKLHGKIDFAATYENTITSTFKKRGFLPIVAKDARQAYSWALRCANLPNGAQPRIARIQSTLKLDELYVSDALLAQAQNLPGASILGGAQPLFTEQGELTKF